MPIYTMEVVCQVITIQADNEEQAELKYDAHFDSDEECPCGVEDCNCVDDAEDVYHITTSDEEKSLEIPVEVIEKALWNLKVALNDARNGVPLNDGEHYESDEYYQGAIWALSMILEAK